MDKPNDNLAPCHESGAVPLSLSECLVYKWPSTSSTTQRLWRDQHEVREEKGVWVSEVRVCLTLCGCHLLDAHEEKTSICQPLIRKVNELSTSIQVFTKWLKGVQWNPSMVGGMVCCVSEGMSHLNPCHPWVTSWSTMLGWWSITACCFWVWAVRLFINATHTSGPQRKDWPSIFGDRRAGTCVARSWLIFQCDVTPPLSFNGFQTAIFFAFCCSSADIPVPAIQLPSHYSHFPFKWHVIRFWIHRCYSLEHGGQPTPPVISTMTQDIDKQIVALSLTSQYLGAILFDCWCLQKSWFQLSQPFPPPLSQQLLNRFVWN